MKQILLIFLLMFSSKAVAEWVEFSTMPNGDVFYFDDSRVDTSDNHVSVWTRVRYKTSVMGAFSYQSKLRLDCAELTETLLQSTFYSDAQWQKPAMATNTNPKPKTAVKPDSAIWQLVDLVCNG